MSVIIKGGTTGNTADVNANGDFSVATPLSIANAGFVKVATDHWLHREPLAVPTHPELAQQLPV
jgi:hypothetical protein